MFWNTVLNPAFLIGAAIVLGGFIPVLLSIRGTWQANDSDK